MKALANFRALLNLSSLGLTALVTTTNAATIVVNTADNTDFSAGKTNLVTAINALANGDTINFNIPGAGPHYLVSPPGGYPIITNIHNVTIDGYSQPGSSPNANPILSTNNANIKVVLDARNGNFSTLANDIPGYGTSEVAILFVLGSTNFSVRGLCFLGTWDYVNEPFDSYAVAFGGGQPSDNGHVSGCRFGLDLDGTTIGRLKDSITGFGAGPNNGIVVGVAPDAPSAAAARAQFNVMIASHIPVIIEGNGTRISGNFFNVYPDGMHDFLCDGQVSSANSTLEAFIEIGSYGNNVVIGTDGDGVNDAEERNVFGGVIDADDHRILEWYGGTRTNTIVAGNYIGVAVDGVTAFTNGGPTMEVIEGFNSTTTVQVGSDFDGVSDDLEANRISWNHPFATLYPNPTDSAALSGRWRFAKLDPGALVSLRGNILLNNNLVPYTYANGTALLLDAFTNFYAPYLETNNGVIPTLDPTNSIFPHLKGVFPPGVAPYTNIMIDVYQLDTEGWLNGKQFALQELTDNFTYTNGFPQGSKVVGSFAVSNTGSFDISLTGFDLGAGLVTVTANYSADPPRTHRARTQTSNFANPIAIIPGGAASVGLTQVVPDVAVWYHSTGNYVTNGPVDTSSQHPDNANWEPYTSVLGDSTFLVAYGTWADDQANQNFIVVKQPAAGGQGKIGYAFYDDSGAPFMHQINLSRQNGNPPRVAGDKRYGANTFITEAETSMGQLPLFQSNNRWTLNSMYSADNRYVSEQLFTLNPLTLDATALQLANDYVWSAFVTNATGWQGGNQISRTGGRPEFLDNGNIVVMIDDRTGYLGGTELTSFAIITPTGSIVKGPTLADTRDIWDNMAAFRGGFAIRAHNLLYFFDNNGNLQSSIDINASSGLSFGTGREDASRIGSDIRSHYVYLAGQSPEGGQRPYPVYVAIWDTRTGYFVAKATVCDIEGSVGALTDRVSIGVDALDRFCVAYSYQPTADFLKRQVAARVMAFDGANITYLTPLFFPFVNHESDPTSVLGMETYHPNVSMTTRQILIAAKGTFNSTNNPAAGPDTAAGSETKLYTVVSHPAPVEAPRPAMNITRSGGNAVVSWSADAGLFTLQSTPSLATPAWAPVTPQPPIVPASTNAYVYTMTVPLGSAPAYLRLMR